MDFKVIGYYITKKHSFLYPQDKKYWPSSCACCMVLFVAVLFPGPKLMILFCASFVKG